MEKRSRGELMRGGSGLCMLLLTLLQLVMPTSAQTKPWYSSPPANISVALWEPAVFRCGVTPAATPFTFKLYGNFANHTLNCPDDKVKPISQILRGICTENKGETLAVWTISDTARANNSVRVVCYEPTINIPAVAFLHVYVKGTKFAITIAWAIGGFLGILLVFGLTYMLVQRSQKLQKCFRGREPEDDDDDDDTIATQQI